MRPLAADESELWRRAMRDVRPLRSRAGTRPAAPSPAAAPLPAASPVPLLSPACRGGKGGGNAAGRRAAAPPPPLSAGAGVDRATAERLRRGRYPVEASLDLHGMTQDEAHRAVSRFLGTARAAGRRLVLVVTGHGRTSGGILKHAVPRWLDEPGLRAQVLMISRARPQHGGDAALYLLLRRAGR